MVVVLCLECQHAIEIDLYPEIGQRVVCPACQVELEVIWLFPVVLDYLEPTVPNPTSFE